MAPGHVDEPRHTQIAATLRSDIATGVLAPGARLDSETKLAERFSASRPTVRQALTALRTEGLIATSARRGTYVRTKPPLSIRSSDHYSRPRDGESTSPFARDAEREGAQGAWTFETVRVRADAGLAERLAIEVDDYVMRTDYIFTADDQPVQKSRSWEPFDLVGGTEIEEPERPGSPGPGVAARMAALGLPLDHVIERVQARRATREEQETLDIPDDVGVIQIQRTYWTTTRPVETCDIVIPADRYVLEYRIPIA